LDNLERTGELEALREVTGATREQLHTVELSPLAALELLHGMMQKLGLDPRQAATQADVISEAQWRCRLCKEWRQCRRWLRTDSVDERYHEFCGNAGPLDRLRESIAKRIPPSRPR
jgi:hypothetical protein